MNGLPEGFLPDDSVFPEDLLELGFVLTKDDKIRWSDAPGQGPRYKINRSDRLNRVHVEALHSVIRTCVLDRLTGMGMDLTMIPKDSNRQVPILMSSNIDTAPRVVVFCGEIIEDLGMFSYRDACDDGIPFGAIVGFAKALLGENAQSSPNALIIANAGHTVWYNEGWRSVTSDTFANKHRGSFVERLRPVTDRNAVNSGVNEHIEDIFQGILMRSNFKVGARIDVIGLSEGGGAVIEFLKNRWGFWFPHISSISLINPESIVKTDLNIDDMKDPRSFAWFMKYRARAWTITDKPIGTRLPGLNLLHGCNTYSSGEGAKSTCMIPRGVGHILTWMNMMHYCLFGLETFDVVPGETDADMEVVLPWLCPDTKIPRLPSGKIEVHSLEVMNQTKGYLTGVTFSDNIVSFFNEKLYPPSDSDSDDNSEFSAAYGAENHQYYDAPLPSAFPDAPPIPEGTYYGDVIRGQTGPFDLSNLQDIREEDEGW
ncbi:hypothetical protein PENVUL_c003G09701 [Penicillium vulpinum]|uniref:Arb2 domain-containing protein n=1 Tax=Penicillium vulpinum TaxID=29845 RepID=A0A1V6SA73_9EURO|nr:hypothetical protein PENVUL_c003G09701 [Penicillium vulpinum]